MLFSKYGPLSEVLLPVDRVTKKGKGIAFITFLMPEHGVLAFNELDRQIFQVGLINVGSVRKRIYCEMFCCCRVVFFTSYQHEHHLQRVLDMTVSELLFFMY